MGSLGGLWAVRLQSCAAVTLLLRTSDSPWQSLELVGQAAPDQNQNQSTQFQFPVEPAQHPASSINHLLVATKSYQALEALDSLRPQLSDKTCIYLMQNGLGSQEAIARAYPDFPVFAVTTTEGANQQGRFRIVHAGRGFTWIGGLTERATLEMAEQTAALFKQAGFESAATPDIREKLWQKLAVNCAINPFTALLDCRNGALPEQPFFQQRISPQCQEIAAALTLAGYQTEPAAVEERVRQVIQGTAENISSMLQDVRAGRRTEIDAINGYLVEFCEAHALPCPINRELVELVKAREPV